MKKSIKVLIAAAISSTLILGGTMLSGCYVTNEYSGEYHYPNAWSSTSPDYGIKVSVEIQSDDKGDRIRKVEVLESDYVEVSAAHGDNWTEENVAKWNDNLNSLLLKYRGAYVMNILEEIVTCESSVPQSVSDSDFIITGATLSSGRLMLAVQNALLSSLTDLGYTVLEGEYHYNYYSEYGMKVMVFVKDDTIMGVKKVDSDYVEVSSANPDRGWTESMVANWNDNLVSLLNAYNGKSVDEVKAVTVTKNGDAPSAVSDDEYVISGATQGSGRLMLAVQDALSKL